MSHENGDPPPPAETPQVPFGDPPPPGDAPPPPVAGPLLWPESQTLPRPARWPPQQQPAGRNPATDADGNSPLESAPIGRYMRRHPRRPLAGPGSSGPSSNLMRV